MYALVSKMAPRVAYRITADTYFVGKGSQIIFIMISYKKKLSFIFPKVTKLKTVTPKRSKNSVSNEFKICRGGQILGLKLILKLLTRLLTLSTLMTFARGVDMSEVSACALGPNLTSPTIFYFIT